MPLEPVAAAMEVGCSGFAGHLHLCAGVSSKFGALAGGGHLEFCDRIHADAISELLVHARVGHGLTIDRKVVLIRALPIERGAARDSIRGSARNRLQQSRKIPSV